MGLRTHAVIWTSILLLVFFYVGYFTFGADPARIVILSLVVGVNTAICISWFRRFVEALRSGVKDGAQNIFVGIWLKAFVNSGYFFYVGLVIALGNPYWLRNSPIGGTFFVAFFLASAALLLAPINTTEEIEPTSLKWWLFAVAMGGVTSGVMMTLAFLGIFEFG